MDFAAATSKNLLIENENHPCKDVYKGGSVSCMVDIPTPVLPGSGKWVGATFRALSACPRKLPKSRHIRLYLDYTGKAVRWQHSRRLATYRFWLNFNLPNSISPQRHKEKVVLMPSVFSAVIISFSIDFDSLPQSL